MSFVPKIVKDHRPTSWKVEVQADDSGTWASNAVRFASREEAGFYMHDLAMRWTSVRQVRLAASSDPVNYAWLPEHGLHRLEGKESVL